MPSGDQQSYKQRLAALIADRAQRGAERADGSAVGRTLKASYGKKDPTPKPTPKPTPPGYTIVPWCSTGAYDYEQWCANNQNGPSNSCNPYTTLDDCLDTATAFCDDQGDLCYGVMVHTSWSPLHNNFKWCTSPDLVPKTDWIVRLPEPTAAPTPSPTPNPTSSDININTNRKTKVTKQAETYDIDEPTSRTDPFQTYYYVEQTEDDRFETYYSHETELQIGFENIFSGSFRRMLVTFSGNFQNCRRTFPESSSIS